MPLPHPHPHNLTDAHLPEYSPAAVDLAILPSYSQKPHHCEYVLDYDVCCWCSRNGGEHIYESDDVLVNLGDRIWGFETPTYGFQGAVNGHVVFKEKGLSADQLCVALVISVKIAGQRTRKLWCQRKQLYNSSVQSYTRGEKIKFSFAIPSEISVNGVTIPSPPSQLVKVGASKAAVSYELVVGVSKRGFLKNQSYLNIPILHLPKTRPKNHPIKVMPKADCEGRPYCKEQGVYTVALDLKLPEDRPIPEDRLPSEVYYSRPDVESFASGSVIPVVLTINLKHIPEDQIRAYLGELAKNTSINLYRQTRISSSMTRHGWVAEDTRLDHVFSFEIQHVAGGVYQLHGEIDTGSEGRESSWHIPDAIEVKYFIRMQSRAKSGSEIITPTFSYKDQIALTTDPWGTSSYELNSTYGIPVPAIGLTESRVCPCCRSLPHREVVETVEDNSSPDRFKITII